MIEVILKTEILPEIDEELFKKLCPPYKVILHNDDYNSMEHVIVSLLKAVPSLTEEEAIQIMLTAHNEGSAVVIVCPKETAEYYQDRILTFGITATIEPDE